MPLFNFTLAPIDKVQPWGKPGNLQVLWPEGNIIIRRGVVDKGGGVPDYDAMVRIEKVED